MNIFKLAPLAIAMSAGLAACGGDDNNTNSSSNTLTDTGDFTLQLLHFADVDGGRDIATNVEGFAVILDQFRNETDYENNTLVLSSGDNWIPGPEYNVANDSAMAEVLGAPDDGRAHIAYLNAMEVDASAFGNHEFDVGTGAIADLLLEEGEYLGAQFPYLSTNLDFSGDEDLAPLVAEDGLNATQLANKISSSTVITVNGVDIGVIGATTPVLDDISSPGEGIVISGGDSTEALAAVIQEQVDALTAEGIDKIILLAHMQQISIEKELAVLLENVDIIVAGGSNTILADDNDYLRDGDEAADDYPLEFTSPSDEPVLVVNTDGDFTYLGRLVVTFDESGVIDLDSLDDEVNGAYATDEQGLLNNSLSLENPTDDVQGVYDISEALFAALESRAGNIVGRTDVYLNGERGSVRTEETNFGNLTAQANLVYAQNTDSSVAISIKNGGGIRGPIGACIAPEGSTSPDDVVCSKPLAIAGIRAEGDISQLDVETSLRFNNELVLLTLTGSQLHEIIEHAVSEWAEDATPGSFGQVAGIRYSFDPTQEVGSRIQNLIVLDDNGADDGGDTVVVVENGAFNTEISVEEFRIVTLSYLAGGGDSYPFPQEPEEGETSAEYDALDYIELYEEGVVSGVYRAAENGTEQDALSEYLILNHLVIGTLPYAQEDTDAEDDQIIQNLSLDGVEDTVAPAIIFNL